jgi:hypothetical protein
MVRMEYMDGVSTLEVVWTTRQGGDGRTERPYLDFVIDGVALSSQVSGDFITPFGWLDASEHEASIDRLLGKSPPDMRNGRTALYICPECGDLACGAVTLLVARENGVIVWKNFGFENTYEDVLHTAGLENIGPFAFDATQYHELFERLRRLLNS